MKALLGTKLGMTQIFDPANGGALGVTVIEVMPATVTRVKTAESDGYEAALVGAGEKKRAGKALLGQHDGKTAFKVLKEFRDLPAKAGDTLGLDQFEAGEDVQVSSVSKGKGFQGTIKRHNFSRGPKTHGSRNYRRPGSIGGTGASRVFPGQKMPGRMGNQTVTQRGLQIAAIHTDDNVLLLKGSVPGKPGTLVTVTSRADAPQAEAEKTEEQS
jgi:large subunit ribosomal protein L3